MHGADTLFQWVAFNQWQRQRHEEVTDVSSSRATYKPIQNTVGPSKHRGVSTYHYSEVWEIGTRDEVYLWVPFRWKNFINDIIFFFFFLSSNRLTGLLRSSAISLEVSLLTVFLWWRSEAFVLVVWTVALDLNTAASFFCIVLGILLWVLF